MIIRITIITKKMKAPMLVPIIPLIVNGAVVVVFAILLGYQ